MKIIYDPKYNIAYIQLREKIKDVETLKISDEVNIDWTPDGKIYGIELLNANDQLDLTHELTLLNEQTQQKVEPPIAI